MKNTYLLNYYEIHNKNSNFVNLKYDKFKEKVKETSFSLISIR